MVLAQLALTIYLAADVERPAAGAVGIVVLVAIATLEIAVMIAFARIGRSGGSDDDQDQGGDDPGWGRGGPRTPPPDAPVCWPEFERQFAEHVAAIAERQAPASSSSLRGRRAFDVRPERKRGQRARQEAGLRRPPCSSSRRPGRASSPTRARRSRDRRDAEEHAAEEVDRRLPPSRLPAQRQPAPPGRRAIGDRARDEEADRAQCVGAPDELVVRRVRERRVHRPVGRRVEEQRAGRLDHRRPPRGSPGRRGAPLAQGQPDLQRPAAREEDRPDEERDGRRAGADELLVAGERADQEAQSSRPRTTAPSSVRGSRRPSIGTRRCCPRPRPRASPVPGEAPPPDQVMPKRAGPAMVRRHERARGGF